MTLEVRSSNSLRFNKEAHQSIKKLYAIDQQYLFIEKRKQLWKNRDISFRGYEDTDYRICEVD